MSKTILLVDDESDILEILQEALEPLKTKFLTAKNGQEALKILESNPVDVVITDVNMPVMNGIEFLKAAKKQNLFLPVIMLTAFGDKKLIQDAWHEGAFDFLDKPVTLETALKVVENALHINDSTDYTQRRDALDPHQEPELTIKINRLLLTKAQAFCKENSTNMDKLMTFLLEKFLFAQDSDHHI